MDRIEEKMKMEELIEQLNRYRDSYYNRNVSEVSDYEYDNLYDELKTLEEWTGICLSTSPTRTVGYEVKSKLNKTKHSHPMLSLDKTKSVDKLIDFASDKDCLLSLKMDGLTVLLTYENGELVKAETRGDGYEGEDITHNAKVFSNIPLTIPTKRKLEVEGEAVIDYHTFEKINEKLSDDQKYKNPRNLVSGSVRQLDNKVAKERNIKFVAWKVPTQMFPEEDVRSNSYLARLEFIKCLGFCTVPLFTYVNELDKENIQAIINTLREYARDYGYPIDGLVMTYNDIHYGESLGMTGHHPKHSIAFKFYEEEADTVLTGMEWSMGKLGTLTPVAIFEPVELCGTTVERASLHNLSVMKETLHGYGYIGQPITVVKKNEIIPQIVSAEPCTDWSVARTYVVDPSHCPICGSPTEIKKDKDSEVLVCTNHNCKGKLLGRLSHFVSKKGMSIDGLSEETLKKFIELGWLSNLSDIYKLENHFKQLSIMEGFGTKSVKKLKENIEKSKNVDLQHFIASLSISGIGTSQSKVLAKTFKTWEEFVKAGSGNMDLSTLDGFGKVLNNNIHTWFETMYVTDGIDELSTKITFKVENNNSEGSDLLNGKTFVITGSLTHYKNRKELQDVIESNGGKVSGSVSKNTYALINNDVRSSSSKNKKAKELGVRIITEEEFSNLIK